MTGEEKLQELTNNDVLMNQLFTASTPDAFVAILAANGVSLDGISNEEAYAAFHGATNDELDENDLENVAGGVAALATLAICATGPIGWMIGAAALGVIGHCCYKKAKKR